MFRRLRRTRLWTLAAVDGHCIGGAFDLALACDAIVATPGALFRHPGARFGFPTAYGGNRMLALRAGVHPALRLLLEGGSLTGEEACGIGLVAQLLPAATDWLDRVERYVSSWPRAEPASPAWALQLRTRASTRHAPVERSAARLAWGLPPCAP